MRDHSPEMHCSIALTVVCGQIIIPKCTINYVLQRMYSQEVLVTNAELPTLQVSWMFDRNRRSTCTASPFTDLGAP
ncbi:hypothetical protein PR048_007612 [Dryococelus australis]|uniref:Uncharacterized protein n=1 Tax=Dryococelus australis TaxID=614101 RepID=A0ABQ9HUZ5_9NEOP|nr:hypothetical protein PR048_007612 [Dryococelus australis]